MSESTSVLVQTETVGATVIVTGATVIGTVPIGPQGPAGPAGATGAQGPAGPAGADGEGVPIGGTAGQVLTKDSGTDFDTSWQDPTGGGSGVVESVVEGTGINVDAADPANPIVALENEAYTSAEKTKLAGIEAGATADQTAAELLTAIKTVDGAGSGLDADLLDGLSSAAFATAAQGTAADAAKAKTDFLTVTQAVDLDTIEARVNSLDAAVVLRGNWDASAGTFPGGGTAQAGDSYIVTVAGTVNAVAFSVGDRIVAITDNASTGTYAANWLKLDYTDQVLSVNGRTGAVVGLAEQSSLDTVESDLATAIADGDASTLTSAQTYADGKVSDTAYDSTSWNGVTGTAPSKNAVRDKFETLGTMATETATNYVAKSLYDANSILAATSDDAPAALTVAASRVVGRKASGDIAAMTGAETAAVLAGEVFKQAQEVNAQTGTTYTLVAGDAGKLVTLSNASPVTLTLPQDSDATIAVGTYIDLYALGAGQVTVAAGTGATLRTSGLTAKSRAQYARMAVQKVSANTWSLMGDLASS